MNSTITEKIIKEVKLLKNVGDSCGIKLANDKGLFIQVEQKEEFNSNEMEYFIELNEVDNENCYEPCGDYNERAEFGNMEILIDKIEKYLKYHGIIQ